MLLKGGYFMKKENLKLNKNTKFLIYGGGFFGRRVCKILLEQQLCVECFIDNNAANLSLYHSVPIYHPDSFELTQIDRVNTVVVICILNYFEHEQIASALHEKGFLYILGKYNIIQKNNDAIIEQLNILYDKLVNGKTIRQFSIPQYESNENKWFTDGAIISKDKDTVLAYVPAEQMFFSESSLENNIVLYSLYVKSERLELFNTFDTVDSEEKNDIMKKYVQESAKVQIEYAENISSNYFRRIIASRYDIYQNMDLAYNLNPGFFYDNPPIVEYRNNGTFYVKDGTHRISFLLSKGLIFIPCKMSSIDYDSWLNINVLEKLEYLKIIKLFLPIMHPYFMYYPFYSFSSERKKLKSILFFLKKKNANLTDMKVLEFGCDSGYYTQFFLNLNNYVFSYDLPTNASKLKEVISLLNIDNKRLMQLEALPEEIRIDFIICLNNENNILNCAWDKILQYSAKWIFYYGRIEKLNPEIFVYYKYEILFSHYDKDILKHLYVFIKK